MLKYDDISLVAAVAAAGGPRAAAQRLRTHAATVYRRLRRIETAVGGRLFERIDGRYLPTELAGQIIEAAGTVEAQLIELNRRLAGADDRLHGTVSVTTTDSLLPIVCEALGQFQAEQPAISIRLTISNAFADMARHEAEVAIRPTRTPPETLVGQRVAQFDYAVYRRASRWPTEESACWIGLDESLASIPSARWTAEHVDEELIATKVNSMWAAAEAAAAGLGLALLPVYLAEGRPLEPVGQPIPEIASELWVLTHPDLRHTPRIRAFTGSVARYLRQRFAAGTAAS